MGLLEPDVFHADYVWRCALTQSKLISVLKSEACAVLIDECESPRLRRRASRHRKPDAASASIGTGKPHALARGLEALYCEPFVRIRRARDSGARSERRLLPT
jgi:hypothetical protein